MTQPGDEFADLTFSDAAPIPDHTATEETAPPITPPPNPGADATTPRRRRLLPGKIAPTIGTQDFSRSHGRQEKVNGKPERKPLPPIPNSMKEDLEGVYAMIGLSFMMTDPELADAILKVAPQAAEAWVELARKNHAVRRILLRLLETSAWGAVLTAHRPLFMLMFNRMTGQSVRHSMIGEYLAKEVHPEEGESTE